MGTRIAICFLSKEAPPDLLAFSAQSFSAGHDVFIVSDKDTSYAAFHQCICIPEDEARQAGFWGVNCVDWIPKDLMALDKALYYFCRVATDYDYVWFIEDDVFVPRANLLAEIDAAYPTADLITKEHVSAKESATWCGWCRTDLLWLNGPHYKSLNCAMRLSRRMLQCVTRFVKGSGRLVFLEFLFNSLANEYQMEVATPEQLSTIQFEPLKSYAHLDKNHLYHAVKDFSLHTMLRAALEPIP